MRNEGSPQTEAWALLSPLVFYLAEGGQMEKHKDNDQLVEAQRYKHTSNQKHADVIVGICAAISHTALLFKRNKRSEKDFT